MKINLETLSPVHVGSGVQYQGNAEYIYFEHERVLTIIDESRVLDIIGPENIHVWVGYIESRENQKTFLE
ncbi:MAG: type III-A CRISPR-associated RAMP protein Csm5, partial [Bacteroidota bacterium]